MAAPESPPLRDEPAVEVRIAIDLDAFQKISTDERGQLLLSQGRKCPDAPFNCACNLECIDNAIGEVQSDSVSAGVNTLFCRFIDDASELAQAPTKFSARVVWNIPQQVTQLSSGHRGRSEAEVAEQCSHF